MLRNCCFSFVKVGLLPSKKILFYLLDWKLFKSNESIFKFFSQVFGHVEKTTWLKTQT